MRGQKTRLEPGDMVLQEGWIYQPSSSQVTADLEALLADQFTSPSHYAQVVGMEYGQIGIAIYYIDEQGSFLFVEDIKMGE